MNIFQKISSWLFGAGKSGAQTNGNLSNRLYVGNISFDSTENDLEGLFSKYGRVSSVSIIRNRFTGRPKGYAFVEMSSGEEASRALVLSGTEFGGRKIVVSQAKERKAGGEGREPRRREGRSGGGGNGGERERSRGGRRRGGGGGRGRGRDRGGDRGDIRDDRGDAKKKMERWEEEDHSNYQ